MPEEQKEIIGGNRDVSTDSSSAESRTGDGVSSLFPCGCVMAHRVHQRELKDTKSITATE